MTQAEAIMVLLLFFVGPSLVGGALIGAGLQYAWTIHRISRAADRLAQQGRRREALTLLRAHGADVEDT